MNVLWLCLAIAISTAVIGLMVRPRRRKPLQQPRPPRGPLGRVLRDHSLHEAMYHAQHQDDEEERSA